MISDGTNWRVCNEGVALPALQEGLNINLTSQNNITTISANLAGYALTSDMIANLGAKQDTLLASATGTPLLNGSVIRSISAGANVTLGLQNTAITVSVPTFRGNAVTVTGTATVPTSVFGGFLNARERRQDTP